MNPILVGQAETFDVDLPKIGTVWMDETGALGVIEGYRGGDILARIKENVVEVVNFYAVPQFMQTMECLGDL